MTGSDAQLRSNSRLASTNHLLRSGAMSLVVLVSLGGFWMMSAAELEAATVESGSSIESFLTQGASASGPIRIKYQGPNGSVSLSNHDEVRLSDDLSVTVAITPYPPTTFDADVDLLLTDASGAPIDGASIIVDWDMAVMGHGPFNTTFESVGNGHYTAPFHFFMFGPWLLETAVSIPGQQQPSNITLSIYVWPE